MIKPSSSFWGVQENPIIGLLLRDHETMKNHRIPKVFSYEKTMFVPYETQKPMGFSILKNGVVQSTDPGEVPDSCTAK